MTASSLVLLDGGMGRELQRRGLAPVTGAWSAEALLDHPDVVRDLTALATAWEAELIEPLWGARPKRRR